MSLSLATACGDDGDDPADDVDGAVEEVVPDGSPGEPDADPGEDELSLNDNEGGEIRLEWIQNTAGLNRGRMTAFFYKTQNPAHNTLPAFPGCINVMADDVWPFAQGVRTYVDVGNVIVTGGVTETQLVRSGAAPLINPSDFLSRTHDLWYRFDGTPGTDGDMRLPANTSLNVIFTGSAEWPAQVIADIPFMPAAFTPISPVAAGPFPLVAATDAVITFTPGNSTNLPAGSMVNTVVAFQANGVVGGPVVVCQEEGTDGSITIPAATVDVLRGLSGTGGSFVRQNLTHRFVELTDGTPRAEADRKRVDLLTIYCFNANWTAP